MSREILSLKGLYQFLFVKDYPVFSNGIISKSNKVGLTLTKFWQENVLIDFRNLKYGRMVWRTEGGRNRYISEFCNRSERISFYEEYVREWGNIVNQDVLLRQINQFSGFLLERNYHYDVFVQKLEAYIKVLSEKDSAFSKGAEMFFEEALEDRRYLEEFGLKGQAFFCGWILSFLMLHAMAGNGEDESFLRQLRRNQEISLRSLGKLFVKAEKPSKRDVKLLTTKNSEICREALDGRHFFGREEELFELLDMLKVGGKYLISGIGGIGKTEIMRQLLQSTIEDGLADYVCVVQYEGSMADSLIRAFGRTYSGDKEIKLQESLAMVHMHADERVLMLVDNVSHSVEEDKDIELLLKLPATIFMTSRYQTMQGFETYNLKPISKNAGALIFRDNYALPINSMDKQLLMELLEKDIWCHTLTLRLLGKAARAKNWTLQEMLVQLDADGKAFNLDIQNGYENLKQLYRQIYSVSRLDVHMNHFLQMFALLPCGSYGMDFIGTYLSDFLGKGINVEQSVEQLWESGWLERSVSGYSMHPFVAECILVKEVSVEDVLPFFDRVLERMETRSETLFIDAVCMREITDSTYDLSREEENAVMTLGKVMQRITGVPKERYLQLVLLAFYLEMTQVGVSKEIDKRIEALWNQAESYSEINYISALIALQTGGYDNPRVLEQEYDKVLQMKLPDVILDTYKISLGKKILAYTETDFRWRVGKDNWAEENRIPVRSNGAYMLSILHSEQGDIEKLVSYLQEGLALWKDAKDGDNETRKMLRLNLAHVYSSLGRHEEAEALLKGWNPNDEDSIYMKFMGLLITGVAKREKRAPGLGIRELEEVMDLAEVLFIHDTRRNHFIVAAELALAYQRAERYEDAILFYQKAFDISEQFDCDRFSIHRITNNLGVTFLSCGRLEEALECFASAYEIGREMGGLAQAEPANNLSKLWEELGDMQKALQYLEEALPVLEQFYGSEHPKVVEAKKRREESLR